VESIAVVSPEKRFRAKKKETAATITACDVAVDKGKKT